MARSTRPHLIEAAYEMFLQRGFHDVGLDAILRKVGVTKTTFYNHFDSKDSLVLEVLKWRDQVEQETLARLMREHGGRTARGRLGALFDALDAWFRLPGFRGCIFITAAAEYPLPSEPAHRVAASHKIALRNRLLDLAREAEADRPELLADLLALLIEGAIVLRHVSGNTNAAGLAGEAAALLLHKHLPPLRTAPKVAASTACTLPRGSKAFRAVADLGSPVSRRPRQSSAPVSVRAVAPSARTLSKTQPTDLQDGRTSAPGIP
jgi:AcrR family transcriptional regulator